MANDTTPDNGQKSVRLLAIAVGPSFYRGLARHVESLGVSLERAPDQDAALDSLRTGAWDAVFVTLDEDPEDHLCSWDKLLKPLPSRPRLIAMVPAPSIALTLRAIQIGGVDVIPRPLWRDQLREALHRLCSAAVESALPLPDAAPVAAGPYQLVSQSPAMLTVYQRIAQAAGRKATVLIVGESGTGKELVAKAIHRHGPRPTAPLVAVNCAAIPENLLESELFGHEKGAFTGAVVRKIGRFERASGGTLLLDEIGDMSLALQSKILRAIQEREIERVGGTHATPVDVRLIAATNCNLPALIDEGRFREDLYYRIAVMTIHLPRLADRDDDVLILTAHFLREIGLQYGKSFSSITDRALDMLRNHDWPGNVRELRNVIERAVLVADSGTLRSEHLPEDWRRESQGALAARDNQALTLREVEARHIARILNATQGRIREAAHILGVHRNTLARKIKEYHL